MELTQQSYRGENEGVEDIQAYINDLMSDIQVLETVVNRKTEKLIKITEQEELLKLELEEDRDKIEQELRELANTKQEVEESLKSLEISKANLELEQESLIKGYEESKIKNELEIETEKNSLENLKVEKRATEKIVEDKMNHLEELGMRLQNASSRFKKHALFIVIDLALIVFTLYILPSSDLFTYKYLFLGVLVAVFLLGTVTIYNIISIVSELYSLVNFITDTDN